MQDPCALRKSGKDAARLENRIHLRDAGDVKEHDYCSYQVSMCVLFSVFTLYVISVLRADIE